MSKFQLLNTISLIAIAGILLADFHVKVLVIVVCFVYVGLLVIGSIFIRINFYLTSINKGKSVNKQIAISFDDGPDEKITRQLLAILKKHNIQATFFCVGSKVEHQKDLIKQMDDDGHIIGNHSYSHSNRFSILSVDKMKKEIELTNQLIEDCIGKKPLLFRPPFGVTNPLIARLVKITNMTSVGWSLRSFDTFLDIEKVQKKIRKRLQSGDILLFHDNKGGTIQVIEEFIPWLKQNNFSIVGLDTLLNIKTYE